MAKSLDHVQQPDGSWRWEVTELKPKTQETTTLVPGELGISESAPEKGVLKGKATKKKVAKKKTDSPLSE